MNHLAMGFALLTLVVAIVPIVHLYRNRQKPGAFWLLWACVVLAIYPLDVLLQPGVDGLRHRYATLALVPPLYYLAVVEYLRAQPRHWSLVCRALLASMVCVFVAPRLPGDWYLVIPAAQDVAATGGVVYDHATGAWIMKGFSYCFVVVAAQMAFARMSTAAHSKSSLLGLALLPLVAGICDLVSSIVAHHPYTGIGAVQIGATAALLVLTYALLRKKLLSQAPVPTRVLMSRMREGVCVISSTGVILDSNSPFSAIIGIPEGKLVGRLAKHVLPEVLLTQLDIYERRGLLRNAQVRLESSNRWVTVNLVKLEEAETDSSLLLSVTDITDQTNELQHLSATAEELEESNLQLETLSLTDSLTGLGNRRQLQSALLDYIDERRDESSGLIMIGVDNFKTIGDTHGLRASDVVLVCLAGSMREICRDSDTLVRWDGGQFGLLLRATDEERLEQTAERLRAQIRRLVIELDNGVSLQVTVSVGAALVPTEQEPEAAFVQIDQLLGEAAQKAG